MYQPILELEEYLLPCPLQASLSVFGAVTGVHGVAHAVEKGQVHRFLFFGRYM